MMRLARKISKSTIAFTLAFALGGSAAMIWIYNRSDEKLGIASPLSFAAAKENVLVWWYKPHAFKATLAPKDLFKSEMGIVPNPLMIIISVDENKRIAFNGKTICTLDRTDELRKILIGNFQTRLVHRAYFYENSTRDDLPEYERIERTVYLQASDALTHEEFIKLLDEVKGAGAKPIMLLTDKTVY